MIEQGHQGPQLGRRQFLQWSAILTGASLIPQGVWAALKQPQKTLSFTNLHTGEFLKTAYWVNDGYDNKALNKVNHMLRDHHSGDVTQIDPRLLDYLHVLMQKLDYEGPIEVVCGYRSLQTNAKLRKKSKAVAKKSLHIQGKALDFRLPRQNLKKIRDAAADLRLGGVGYYPGEFVHIDTGDFRTW